MSGKKKAAVLILVALLAIVSLGGVLYLRRSDAQRAALAAERMAAEQAAIDAAAEAQAAKEQAAMLEAERRAAEEAASDSSEAELAAQSVAALETKEDISYADCIGTVRVEGTQIDCDLYWGDTGNIFRNGAGCHADDGCVMPGENGTVFVGGHTDTWFVDLKSAEIGKIVYLDTIYGEFQYIITDLQVIGDTEIDKCRWGDAAPSCILYTCYPFGIQTPTNQRYLVYADPVTTDASGVVPSNLP